MLVKKQQLDKLIKYSIQEDIGIGDITSSLLISKKQKGIGKLLVKEDCILAGTEICRLICKYVDKNLQIEFKFKDGDSIKSNTIIGFIKGSVSSILLIERVILNYIQRMSGIATKTNYLVSLIDHTHTKILDTRKTTPNFRIFEKIAVKIGGGINHRFGLYDEILVKDNHIAANKNLKKTLDKLQENILKSKKKYKIVVEVKNIIEFQIAANYKWIDRILLDNMTVAQIKKIVKLNDNKHLLEASGGINRKSIKKYAATGVDFLSIGELTHHTESVDISLKLF